MSHAVFGTTILLLPRCQRNLHLLFAGVGCGYEPLISMHEPVPLTHLLMCPSWLYNSLTVLSAEPMVSQTDSALPLVPVMLQMLRASAWSPLHLEINTSIFIWIVQTLWTVLRLFKNRSINYKLSWKKPQVGSNFVCLWFWAIKAKFHYSTVAQKWTLLCVRDFLYKKIWWVLLAKTEKPK